MSGYWQKIRNPSYVQGTAVLYYTSFVFKCVHYKVINYYFYVGVKKVLQFFIFRMIMIFGMKLNVVWLKYVELDTLKDHHEIRMK